MNVIMNSFCLVKDSKIFKGFFRKLGVATESSKANVEVKRQKTFAKRKIHVKKKKE